MNASELKDFLANICVESYVDVKTHRNNVQYLEENFPTYSEKTECDLNGDNMSKRIEQKTWGDFKLGRIPAFLYEDARKIPTTLPSDEQTQRILMTSI